MADSKPAINLLFEEDKKVKAWWIVLTACAEPSRSKPLVICRMISLVSELSDEILHHIPTLTGYPSNFEEKALREKKRSATEKRLADVIKVVLKQLPP